MSMDPYITELETRIAFLEDSLDTLNLETHRLSQANDKLNSELHALAKIVKPMMQQLSELGGSDDSAPPPHY
jgi:SlyX protein